MYSVLENVCINIWKKTSIIQIFRTNIVCKETRLERLSLAENCFASPRKYHGQENASVSCEALEIHLPKVVKILLECRQTM